MAHVAPPATEACPKRLEDCRVVTARAARGFLVRAARGRPGVADWVLRVVAEHAARDDVP